MAMRSKLLGGLIAASLIAGSVAPAAARGYDNRWGGDRWRHRDNGPSAGAIFGVLLGVGVIAAIASANAKKAREAENGGYGDRGYDPRADQRNDDSPRYDNRNPNDRNYGDGRADYAGEDAAVDACAIAARDEASRNGGFADIRQITGVNRYGNGYDVTGTVDQRSRYSATDVRQRSFRCLFENGRVSGVTFGTSI